MVSLMKGSARSLGLLLSSLLALCACGEVSNEQSESATEELRLDPCEETTASYETVGEPFMRTWCTSCHHSQLEGADRPAGSEGVNLDSFERVLQHLDRIEARALSATPTLPHPKKDQ